MDCLQVDDVIGAGDEPPFELSNANGGESGLTLRKLGAVANPEVVSQNIGTGVDVWIVVSHRPDHIELVSPGEPLRGNWSEQIGQRLAGGDPKRRFIELRIGDLLSRPPIQQRLSDTGIKPLSTALGAGVPAALVALDTTRADLRADLINRGIGVGFIFGAAIGFLMFIVFAAKLVS